MESQSEDAARPRRVGGRRGRPIGVAPRPTAQRLEDRAKIAEWYLHGKTTTFIAARLGMERRTVVEEITQLRRGWKESAPRDYRLGMNQELRRVDLVEEKAFDGWERSLARKTVETKQAVRTVNGQVDRATVRAETGNGDPAYLARMSWCIEQRCRILGLEKPVEVEIRGSFVEIAMALGASTKKSVGLLSDDTQGQDPFAWPAWAMESFTDMDDDVTDMDDDVTDTDDDVTDMVGQSAGTAEDADMNTLEASWS